MGSSGGDCELTYRALIERVIQHEGDIAEITKALRLCLLNHVHPVAVIFEPDRQRPLGHHPVISSTYDGGDNDA